MDKLYLKLRNFIGILGCLLTPLCLLFCQFVPDKDPTWWYSISATYYNTQVLVAVLTSVGFFLICYRSYNWYDTLVNTLAGVFAIFVTAFPCNVGWIGKYDQVGLFMIPMYISNIIHCTSAVLLFGLLAINSYFLFSMGSNKYKNILYKVCGLIMAGDFLVFGLLGLLDAVTPFTLPGWMTIVVETIALFAFGVSWITKGHMLDKIFGKLDMTKN